MAYLNTLLVTSGARRRARLFWNIAGAVANLKMRLYTNNHIPACPDDLSNYTECTLSGYVFKDILGTDWTEVLSSACGSAWQYATLSWTFTTGGVTIYGAYIVDNDSGLLVAAGNFTVSQSDLTPDPFVVPGTGGIFQVGLTSRDKDCNA